MILVCLYDNNKKNRENYLPDMLINNKKLRYNPAS